MAHIRTHPIFFIKLRENPNNWELSNEPIILCGNWSMVLNYNYNDTINYLKNNNLNAQKSVQELIDTFELGDVYRPGTNWTYM